MDKDTQSAPRDNHTTHYRIQAALAASNSSESQLARTIASECEGETIDDVVHALAMRAARVAIALEDQADRLRREGLHAVAADLQLLTTDLLFPKPSDIELADYEPNSADDNYGCW